jgi:hypothetical protein
MLFVGLSKSLLQGRFFKKDHFDFEPNYPKGKIE